MVGCVVERASIEQRGSEVEDGKVVGCILRLEVVGLEVIGRGGELVWFEKG